MTEQRGGVPPEKLAAQMAAAEKGLGLECGALLGELLGERGVEVELGGLGAVFDEMLAAAGSGRRVRGVRLAWIKANAKWLARSWPGIEAGVEVEVSAGRWPGWSRRCEVVVEVSLDRRGVARLERSRRSGAGGFSGRGWREALVGNLAWWADQAQGTGCGQIAERLATMSLAAGWVRSVEELERAGDRQAAQRRLERAAGRRVSEPSGWLHDGGLLVERLMDLLGRGQGTVAALAEGFDGTIAELLECAAQMEASEEQAGVAQSAS